MIKDFGYKSYFKLRIELFMVFLSQSPELTGCTGLPNQDGFNCAIIMVYKPNFETKLSPKQQSGSKQNENRGAKTNQGSDRFLVPSFEFCTKDTPGTAH